MQTNHHLNEQLLMGYAAGVLPEAFNLVVATHLCLSDESRAMLGSYESIGGCVMSRCAKAKMGKNALAETMAKIKSCEETEGYSYAAEGSDCSCKVLPDPLRRYVGGSLDNVTWIELAEGVKQADLPSGKGAEVRLLFVPAGKHMPLTASRGLSLTLVLCGGFSDGVGTFERGDIRISQRDQPLNFIVSEEADCVCLSASETDLGIRSYIQNRLQRVFVR